MKKLFSLILAFLLAVPLFAETFTVTKQVSEVATEYGWVTTTTTEDVHYYPNFKLDKVVTITAKDATPQTSTTWNGVYYANTTDATKSDWRMYQARNGGEFNFSVAVGYQLKSITLTYSNKNDGVVGLVSGSSIATGNQVASNAKLTLGARVFSKTLYVGATSTKTNGQARITKFSVEYESVPVDTLYLNTGGSGLWNQAGAKFSVWYWNDGEEGHFTPFLEPAFGETDIYRAIIPKSDSVIFVRHDAAADVPTWDNKWNQTKSDEVDLEIGNIMVITGWQPADREWDYYTPKEEKFYVTGDSLLLDGRTEKAKWAADAIEMVGGSYTFTNLAAGDYQMKVTKGDWNLPSYGYEALSKSSSANIYDKGGNIRFIVATPGDVKVDYADGEVTVTGNFAPISTTYNVEVPAGTPNCYIAGSFNGWTFQQMNMVDSANYTLTLVGELQDSVYKYTCGKDWKYVENIAENRTYNASDEVEAWKKVPGATFADTYTSNISEITGSKVVVFGDTVDAYKGGTNSVAGSVKITIPAGTKTLHFHALGWKGETVTLTVDGQAYNINSNDGITSNSPYTLTSDIDPEASAYYTFAANTAVDKEVTITTSAGKRFVLFGVNAEGGYEAPKYYIAGTMTDWKRSMVELTLAEEDSLYRASVALEADSLYAYKVVSVQGTDTAWYGMDAEGTMTYENCTGWWIYKSEGEKNKHNVGLQTTKAADYAFAVDVSDIANKIIVSVAIPKIEYTYDTIYSLVGNFTNWAAGAVAMPYDVENVAKDSVLEYKVIRELITYADSVEVGRDTTWLGQPNEGNQMTRDNNAWKLDGGNNVLLTADVDGTYKFAFATADSTLTVTFPALPEYTYDTVYSLVGNFTNWAAGAVAMPYDVENVAKDSVLEYKVIRELITYADSVEVGRDTTWLGQPNEGNQMTRDNNAWKLDGGNNVLLTADIDGTYKFAFAPADSILTVTFPEKPATYEFASWDFIGDSIDGHAGALLQDKMIAGDTLVEDGISLFYYGVDVATKPLQKETAQGMYWRRSTSVDRAIVMTVPGGTAATVKYALRPGKTSNKYRFYLFTQDAGTTPATFHGNWTSAIDSLDWKYAEYTKDTISINVDLTSKTKAQDLYLLFLDLGGPDKKDNRLRGVSYEKAHATTYDTIFTIAGNFTNWAADMKAMPYEVENVAKDSVLEYKVVRQLITYVDGIETKRDTTWLGQPNEGNQMTRDNNAWKLDGGYNVKLTADAEGTYKFAFTPADSVLTVTFPALPYIYDTIYTIAGNFTNWATDMKAMPYEVKNVAKDSVLEYKVVRQLITYVEGIETKRDTTWLGQPNEGNQMTRDNNAWKLDGGYNVKLTADADGTYKFAFTPADSVLTVTFPEKPATILPRITKAPKSWAGEYAIAAMANDTAIVWTGIDAGQCRDSIKLVDGNLVAQNPVMVVVEAMKDGGYSVKMKGGANDGKYITQNATPAYGNALKFVDSPVRVDIAMNDSLVDIFQTISSTQKVYFLYNKTSGTAGERFRFYKDINYGGNNYMSLTLFGTPAPTYDYDTVMYVAGNFTNWADDMQVLPDTVTMPKDSVLEFKQVRVITTKLGETVIKTDTAWFGQQNEGAYMTRENSKQGWTLDGEYNVLLKTDMAGDYVFSLDGASFKVKFPALPGYTYDTLYTIAGNFTNWATDMQKMPYEVKNVAKDSVLEYKVVRQLITYEDGIETKRDTTWLGQPNEGNQMTRDNNAWKLDGGYNVKLTADETGTYTFDFTPADSVLTVTFPKLLPHLDSVNTIANIKACYEAGTLKDLDTIMVKGYITKITIKPTNFAKYGSAIIWLTDTLGGTTSEFELYNCYGLEKDTFVYFGPGYNTTSKTNIDVDTIVGKNMMRFVLNDYVEARGAFKNFGGIFELTQGCNLTAGGEQIPDMYAKNQWDGTEWTWKDMTYVVTKNQYELNNVVYGGVGVNINTVADDANALWIAEANFLGDKIQAKDTVSFVFNPSDSTLTATLIARPAEPVITHDTIYTLAGNFTNWAAGAVAMPYAVENVAKDSVLEYKVIRQLITFKDGVETKRDTTWLGQPNEGNQMTRDNNAWKLDGGYNVKLTADATGTYTFSFSAADSTLTVTFPDQPTPVTPSYGILLNGTTYYAGEPKDIEGGKEYKVDIALVAGNEVQLYDSINQAAWIVEPEAEGYTDFTKDYANQKYIITNAGQYQFYVKIYTDATSGLYVGYQAPTAIDEIFGGKDQTKKMMKDNQIIIIRNGVWYNATGARIR